MIYNNKFSIPHFDSTQDDDWYLKAFENCEIMMKFLRSFIILKIKTVFSTVLHSAKTAQTIGKALENIGKPKEHHAWGKPGLKGMKFTIPHLKIVK